jgi:hypothetical protein
MPWNIKLVFKIIISFIILTNLLNIILTFTLILRVALVVFRLLIKTLSLRVYITILIIFIKTLLILRDYIRKASLIL